MNDPTYIWISRWEEFQHYAPERDRAPAWIKTYTKQHDDDDYRRLTGPQRAVLHDLRIAFAKSNGRLASEPRALTQRIGMRVTSAQLQTLNHKGFIDICSREVLDQRLEKLYASRARARAHQEEVEVEREEEKEQPVPKPEPEASYETNGTGAGTGNDLEHINPSDILARVAPSNADEDIPF